mgnify:CR=1 FL=1
MWKKFGKTRMQSFWDSVMFKSLDIDDEDYTDTHQVRNIWYYRLWCGGAYLLFFQHSNEEYCPHIGVSYSLHVDAVKDAFEERYSVDTHPNNLNSLMDAITGLQEITKE